jgi:hypothetical protein
VGNENAEIALGAITRVFDFDPNGFADRRGDPAARLRPVDDLHRTRAGRPDQAERGAEHEAADQALRRHGARGLTAVREAADPDRQPLERVLLVWPTDAPSRIGSTGSVQGGHGDDTREQRENEAEHRDLFVSAPVSASLMFFARYARFSCAASRLREVLCITRDEAGSQT